MYEPVHTHYSTESSDGSGCIGHSRCPRAGSPNNMSLLHSRLSPPKAVKPRSNPFIDRVDYRGMLKIVKRVRLPRQASPSPDHVMDLSTSKMRQKYTWICRHYKMKRPSMTSSSK